MTKQKVSLDRFLQTSDLVIGLWVKGRSPVVVCRCCGVEGFRRHRSTPAHPIVCREPIVADNFESIWWSLPISFSSRGRLKYRPLEVGGRWRGYGVVLILLLEI